MKAPRYIAFLQWNPNLENYPYMERATANAKDVAAVEVQNKVAGSCMCLCFCVCYLFRSSE